MRFGVMVPEYGVIPRGYGVAYRAYNRDGSMCYPIPLNWIMRWWLAVFLRLRFPERDTWYERQWIGAYQHGVEVGAQAERSRQGADRAREFDRGKAWMFDRLMAERER